MPRIDPNTLAPMPPQQQPVVTEQAWPGAAMQPSPRARESQRADVRTQVDQSGNARGWDANAMEHERLRIAQEEAERKRKASQANGGVDTTVDNDVSAGHAYMLGDGLRVLAEIGHKDPRLLRPGASETMIKMATDNPELQAWSQSPDRQRANSAFSSVLESTLWLATGAAYNAEQRKGMAVALVPTIFDSPEVLKDKRDRLMMYLQMAKTRAGPALVKNPQLLQNLESIERQAGSLYAPQKAAEADQSYQLDDSNGTLVPLPEEMQQAHAAFLQQHPPGKLTVEDYLKFRMDQDTKYGFGQGPYPGLTEFVNNYNAGKPTSDRLPPTKKELGLLGQIAASAGANTDLGVGAKNFFNAATMGAPELLAGREGRFASELADKAHPKSALAGDILGSVVPVMGAEGLAVRGLGKLGAGEVAARVGGDVAANAGYGAVRGYTGAEPEDRTSAALWGAGGGAVGSLLGRTVVKGAKGFMDEATGRSIDRLKNPETFQMPGERMALPADDITPARYQGMTDAQLGQELAASRRALEIQTAAGRQSATNAADRQAIQAEATRFAEGNANRQERFVRENFRSTMQPEQVAALREEAARQFPTNPAEVLKTPEFAQRLSKIVDPDVTGLEPVSVLQERVSRLEQHLAQDPTPKSGTIPGVDLTTAQRAGLGEGEEFIQGLPGVHNARQSSVESWNRQNSARVLSTIGEELPKDIPAGQEANAYVNQRLNNAYNTLRPSITGRVDGGFNNAVAALRQKAVAGGPERAAMWQEIEATIAKFRKPDGTFDGKGYQEFSEGLRGLARDWNVGRTGTSSTAERELARLAEQVRKQGQAQVSRANPAAGSRLKKLETAWAHQARIDLASRGAAKATRGVYAPDEYLSSIERMDTSRNKAAVSRGQAFDQGYAQDAREVLGAKPAKKGSLKETGIALAAAGGAGYLNGPLTAAMAALGVSSYAPGLKRVMQAMVDGKLGTTVDKVVKNLPADSQLKTLPSDTLNKLIAQALRAKATEQGK